MDSCLSEHSCCPGKRVLTAVCTHRQVDVPQESIVLSERAALTSDLVTTQGLKPGLVVDGVVRKLKDFGAFVALRSPDGHMHGAEV